MKRKSAAGEVCSKRPFYAWQQNRVLPEPPMVGGCETEGSSEVEALQMTPVELFRPRGPSILKKTISPDVKLKSGRVLTWNKPLIELREYEMSDRATTTDDVEWQYDREKTIWEKFLIFMCGAIE